MRKKELVKIFLMIFIFIGSILFFADSINAGEGIGLGEGWNCKEKGGFECKLDCNAGFYFTRASTPGEGKIVSSIVVQMISKNTGEFMATFKDSSGMDNCDTLHKLAQKKVSSEGKEIIISSTNKGELPELDKSLNTAWNGAIVATGTRNIKASATTPGIGNKCNKGEQGNCCVNDNQKNTGEWCECEHETGIIYKWKDKGARDECAGESSSEKTDDKKITDICCIKDNKYTGYICTCDKIGNEYLWSSFRESYPCSEIKGKSGAGIQEGSKCSEDAYNYYHTTGYQAYCEKNCITNPNYANELEGSSSSTTETKTPATKAFLALVKGKEILPLVNAECGYLSDEKENNSYNIGYLIGKILSGKLN